MLPFRCLRFNSFAFQGTKVRKTGLSHAVCSRPMTSIVSHQEKPLHQDAEEITIPVPYGSLAAKAWGRSSGYPVLALHGWLDNCGTFDRLMPLLSKSLYIVTLDLPGHGRSSHKPPGNFYSCLDMMIDIRRVMHHFNWAKCHLIGHSMGGAISLMFCSQFTKLINKLVVLDVVKPMSVPPEKLNYVYAKVIEKNLELEMKINKGPPVYSFESAVKRLVQGMHNEITEESAEILVKRGTKPSDCGTGLVFSRDLRMRVVESSGALTHEGLKSLLTHVENEFLLVKATNTNPFYTSRYPELEKECIEIYKRHSKNFVLKHVDGNHFVHLNNPERVAPLINEFLCG